MVALLAVEVAGEFHDAVGGAGGFDDEAVPGVFGVGLEEVEEGFVGWEDERTGDGEGDEGWWRLRRSQGLLLMVEVLW